MMNRKILFRIFINTALGIILIFVWLKFVDIDSIFKTLKEVKISFALFFFLFFPVSTILRSLRLKILLSKYHIPLRDLIYLTFLGQFLSFLIPIRAGEIAKSVYLSTQFDLPLGRSLIWILLDRFLDFWMNLFLVSLLVLVVATRLPSNFNLILFLVLVSFSAAALAVIYTPGGAKKVIGLLGFFIPVPSLKKLFLNFIHTIIEGFEVLRHRPAQLLILMLVTAGALVSDALIWFFTLLSIGVNMGLLKTLLGSLISALTFLIPAAPGYVGSAEASGLAVFTGILELEPNLASAGTVLNHLLAALAVFITGIISIYLLKFDLGLVWKKLRRE